MADAKLTALTELAQTALDSTNDLVMSVDVSDTSMAATGTNKKITPKSLVGASVSDLAQTWNDGGATFTGVKLNITDTASASASSLMDLQVGGSSKFAVDKSGSVTISSFNHTNLSVASSFADTDMVMAVIDPSGTPSTEMLQGSVLRNSLLNQAATLQFRQGTDAERQAITPASGEPIWTTDTQKFYIGDGTTTGGDFIGPSPYDRDTGAQSIVAKNTGNCASNTYSTVSGGYLNTASGYSSTVAGGGGLNGGNTASNSYSNVSGGGGNIASGPYSTVGGGGGNTASGCLSTVGGGSSNTASGNRSIVSGGFCNTASCLSSIISGGSYNTSSGLYSTVGGGSGNTASGYGSTVSGGSGNTASGYRSTVGGGGGWSVNTASGSFSTVSGGYGNTASGDSSTVSGGREGKATRYGEISHAAGLFAANGDAQHTVLVARKSTTDATANQVMFLDGSSARLTIPAETTWSFEIKLAAYNDTNNEGAWWNFIGGIRRNAANGTALIGSVTSTTAADTSLSTASASVVADDTNEALEIRVTGVAAKNIRWVAVIDISQVSWGTP